MKNKPFLIAVLLPILLCAHVCAGQVEHANEIVGYRMMKSDMLRSQPDNWQIQDLLSMEIAWHCEQLGSIAASSPKMCDMVVRNRNTILGDRGN